MLPTPIIKLIMKFVMNPKDQLHAELRNWHFRRMLPSPYAFVYYMTFRTLTI